MVSILRQLMLKLAQKRGMVAKADRELEIENPTPPVRARIQKKRMKDQQEVERLEQEIRDKVGPDGKLPEGFFEGGMVGSAPPRISQGLSGLIRNYSTGPLARMSVPRGTPQGMFRGGAPGMRGVGFRGPQRIPDIDIDQSAISAALANIPAAKKPGGRPMLDRNATPDIPPPPPVPTNVAIQTPSPSPVTAAETLAAAPIATRTAATPVAQALTGSRPTDFLGFETTEGAAELATAPGQTPFEPGMLLYEGTDVLQSPTGPTAEEIAAQQAAEEAAARAAAEEAARLEAERLAAEEAARIAAEQEAARIQQEQLAAEQLAAQQAAEAAAAAEAQRQAELEAQRQAELEAQRQAELEAQRQAEILAQQEAERIAQEQAAQEAAAQLAAEQLAAEQLAAQEAAAQAEAQRLAEEEAARIAAEEAAQAEAQRIADEAAAEAERVRLAQIAEAERLAEEQRLAELAAAEAAALEQQRIADALAAEKAAEDQLAAERLAQEQLLQQQLADQQAADLLAQQNLEQQQLAAEQLVAQQAAEQSALEAQIAATPDPDPVYTAPTQTELDQAAAVAQTEAGDLFTTPTDTGEVIDRGSFGTVDPVTTTTDTAQAGPVEPQNTPAVITQASDGTFHPTPAAAAAYEQQLAAQQASGTSGLASLLARPDFDVSEAIADYTSGYDSTRDKTFRRTFYPFQELTDEQKENAYIAEVFKPVADVSRFRPALTFGETAGTTTGTTDTTGTDTSGIPTGDVNTGAAASAPGQYGLASNQMYQCPEGYTLAFVNGRATCKSTSRKIARKDVPPEVITLGETA